MKILHVDKPISIDFDTDVIECLADPNCDFSWILDIRDQCIQKHILFRFVSTGPTLIKDGKIYHIPTNQQVSQAKKAQIDYSPNDDLFVRLSHSKFRSSFYLRQKDRTYIQQKGWETIDQHAHDFIVSHLAPAHPHHDGKQTPMKGHPVFLAQHATGTCCRNCLYKWHHIPKEKDLTDKEQNYICQVIMDWLFRQMEK